MSVGHILYISSVTSMHGGAEITLLQFAQSLDRQKFRPHLVTSAHGTLAEGFRRAGIDVRSTQFPYPFRRNRLPFWRAVARLAILARRCRASILHVNCDWAVPHTIAAGGLARVPCVCHVHDTMRAWLEPRYVSLLNCSERIIANSHATASKCRDAGMLPSKVQVLYEPIEHACFARASEQDRTAVRTEFGLGPDSLGIGLVGVIAPHKGQQDLLRAGRTILNEFPDARLIIVGEDGSWPDGTYPLATREMPKALGIASAVQFAGFRTDMPDVMAALDILVVPSLAEAFGKVAAEAMACGKPVVAYRVGGLAEVVQPDTTGLLCTPGCVDELGQAVLRLCRDPELRREMGARGQGRALRFDVHVLTRELEQLYQTAVRPRRPLMDSCTRH